MFDTDPDHWSVAWLHGRVLGAAEQGHHCPEPTGACILILSWHMAAFFFLVFIIEMIPWPACFCALLLLDNVFINTSEVTLRVANVLSAREKG